MEVLGTSLHDNWSIIRVIRLIIGIYVLYGGIIQSDKLFLFFGGLFTIQALFNFGCSSCSSGNCNVNTNKLNLNEKVKKLDNKA